MQNESQDNTPLVQSARAQPPRAAIQPGFLSCQVDDVFTWAPNFIGENVFCLVRRKSRLQSVPRRTGLPQTRRSPAEISLNKGCEEMPSRRKEGWEVGTVGAGAGVGPPGKRRQSGVSWGGFISTPCYRCAGTHSSPLISSHQARHRDRDPPDWEPYRLTRGLPAGPEALLQLRQAWWALWSGLPEPRHFHPGGLISHSPIE